jgi:hypothetical protein
LGGWRRFGSEPVLLLLAAYSVHPFLFLWHHLRHDHYPYGAGGYLLAATMLFAGAAARRDGPLWHGLLLSLSMGFGPLRYLRVNKYDYGPPIEQAVAAVRAVSEPGALISCGLDWSPKLLSPPDARR